MSSENIEIVRAFLDRYNRGDLSAAFELFHEEIVARGYEGSYDRGPMAVAEGFVEWRKDWESFTSHLEEFIDLGDDRAVVICRNMGKGRMSGAELDMVAGEVWGFRDGKIASLSVYRDKAEALEAARSPERDSHTA
jgi:ketosteroid isomerase-like protein